MFPNSPSGGLGGKSTGSLTFGCPTGGSIFGVPGDQSASAGTSLSDVTMNNKGLNSTSLATESLFGFSNSYPGLNGNWRPWPIIVGTGSHKYNPVLGTDVVVQFGVTQTVYVMYKCICCMQPYSHKSMEELRWEDYCAGRKGPKQPAWDVFKWNSNSNQLFKPIVTDQLFKHYQPPPPPVKMPDWKPFPNMSNKVCNPILPMDQAKVEEKPSTSSEQLKPTAPEQKNVLYVKTNPLVMHWTAKLEKLSGTQRLVAEKAINDILYEAELGNLHKNSVKINDDNMLYKDDLIGLIVEFKNKIDIDEKCKKDKEGKKKDKKEGKIKNKGDKVCEGIQAAINEVHELINNDIDSNDASTGIKDKINAIDENKTDSKDGKDPIDKAEAGSDSASVSETDNSIEVVGPYRKRTSSQDWEEIEEYGVE